MADFYNVHLRKTTDPVPILWSKLERGMVVNMTYKKKDGNSKVCNICITAKMAK